MDYAYIIPRVYHCDCYHCRLHSLCCMCFFPLHSFSRSLKYLSWHGEEFYFRVVWIIVQFWFLKSCPWCKHLSMVVNHGCWQGPYCLQIFGGAGVAALPLSLISAYFRRPRAIITRSQYVKVCLSLWLLCEMFHKMADWVVNQVESREDEHSWGNLSIVVGTLCTKDRNIGQQMQGCPQQRKLAELGQSLKPIFWTVKCRRRLSLASVQRRSKMQHWHCSVKSELGARAASGRRMSTKFSRSEVDSRRPFSYVFSWLNQ